MTIFSKSNRFKSECGFALVLTMSMLIILSVLGILVLDATNTDLAITTNYRSSADAFGAAERAVEYASNNDLLTGTEDTADDNTHLALVDSSDNFVTDGDEMVEGTTIADRFGHLQDTATGTELVKSDDADTNVINYLGENELPASLSKFYSMDEFAGKYYRINIEAQARNGSRAAIETQKVSVFKKPGFSSDGKG